MGTESKIAVLYSTGQGQHLAEKLAGLYPHVKIVKYRKGMTEELWNGYDSLIFIMAAGIVVRTVAPFIKDKRSDPAVIVLDDKGKYAISLLSGHLGGANARATEIADFLNGHAVITTASDVHGLASIDLWAREKDFVIEDWHVLPRAGGRLINTGRLNVYTDTEVALSRQFSQVLDPTAADVLITNKKSLAARDGLYLRPRNLIIGIGCNSGTSGNEIEQAVRNVLDHNNLSFLSVRSLATIDRKSHEPGLKTFAQKNSLTILCFSVEVLNTVAGVSRSEAAYRATGANAVAEPAALLASGEKTLLVPKQRIGNVTVAVAEMKTPGTSDVQRKGCRSGKIYVVGTGPGSVAHITPYARDAIKKSDVIVGYGTYIHLIEEIIKGKEIFSTGMTQEIDRCKKAVQLALRGKSVSVISGGDPGIYAMAGLVFELLKEHKGDAPLPPVEVIPGISALNACAARLGAPLMHDFASISLSDRLTPWDLIGKRLDAAASADFVIVLYNPKSKGRPAHINKAREIILKHRSPDTPVGIVKGAMRKDERIVMTDLNRMLEHEIDMQTTVIIGNSRTFLWNNVMITPRGYESKIRC